MAESGAAPVPVRDLEELRAFAESFAAALSPGDIWLLRGELGAGKTTLVREVCKALGVPATRVVSPTFTLVQEYEGGRLPVVHIDLYRVDPGKALDTLFLEEVFERSDCAVFVEWPDVALGLIPPDARELVIETGPAPTARLLTRRPFNPSGVTG
ncbi:MAG: tRNA (adenosine(37)-N6)-threonylcarbamoyltransferase complex ATPase subunit type 1 TsaE [Candidatus Wallbacteria bacterium]|nr:tRNA (adenosine(37)-N6)-threonylcarbamoyltransferase complex ATPase subunit type 1 TsaE [Candidatus Wallbacteria bacterium]